MSDQNQEAYDSAMDELEAIEKSQNAEGTDELDTLTKSLEEELEDDLQKSQDGDADDKGGDSDPEPEGDDKEDDDEDDIKKSGADDFDDELVKASEAYADLQKSVHEFGASVNEELDTLRKSMAALMNLNIKQAKVIASLAKSMPELEAMTKSVNDLAAQPTSPSRAVLGTKDSEPVEALTKSVSEITDMLIKAVSAGTIDSRHLSVYGTYKDVNRLPPEVKTIIGL